MTTQAAEERVYCDCCNPPQLMAIRRGDRLVIHAVHHGKKHVAVVLMRLTTLGKCDIANLVDKK